MSRIEPFIQLRYWGLRPSPELEATIADCSSRLHPFRAQIASCQLHVGRWSLHHGQGKLFRATLSIERADGGGGVEMEEETEPGAPDSARAEVLGIVFSRAAARLKG